ncbi:hypothetical protein BDR04DRAFT_1146442, partial [Suillus decipiens]
MLATLRTVAPLRTLTALSPLGSLNFFLEISRGNSCFNSILVDISSLFLIDIFAFFGPSGSLDWLFCHFQQYLFGSLVELLAIFVWIFAVGSLALLSLCFEYLHQCMWLSLNPSTPPTSPQQAQAAARQAERNQRDIGSPPARRHPAPIAQPLVNAPQMNIPQILGNLNHGPIPMQMFPGLPRNVIEHHEAQRMWRQHHPPPPPGLSVPAPALGPPFGYIPPPAALQNEYERRMANVAAATANNHEARRAARRRRNNPQPAPAPAPPIPIPIPVPVPAPQNYGHYIHGPIHYEGAVGPHNFNNPLQYFGPHPVPPLPAPPQPDYQQFNIQFQHHFQQQEDRQAQDALHQQQIQQQLQQRQAQDALHQQQIQQQLLQQEADRQAQEALHQQQIQQQLQQQQYRQAQDALHQQQIQQQLLQQEEDRQAQEALH